MKQPNTWRGSERAIEEAQRYSKPSYSGSKPSDPARFAGKKSQHLANNPVPERLSSSQQILAVSENMSSELEICNKVG
jgi:hypothetical protein